MKLYVLFVFAIVAETFIYAQTDLIPSDRSIDWSHAGYEGMIPNFPVGISVASEGATGNGTTDDYQSIQSAINKANNGQAVYFPPGTYRITNTLKLKEGIVLRGNCPGTTTLWFDISDAIPCILIESKDRSDPTPVTAGYTKGSSTITVDNPEFLTIGNYSELSQDNDPDIMYTEDTWNVDWAARSVGQMVKITGISGNNISISPSLYLDFNPSLNLTARGVNMIENCGIENLKIFRNDDNEEWNILFRYATNCWIRNIESYQSARGHATVYKSAHIEIRDSYFHHSHNYGAGDGYGITFMDHASDCLVENNIFWYLRHSMVVKEGSNGIVLGYNYSFEREIDNNADIVLHGHYAFMNLAEGNIVEEAMISDYWGPSGPGNTFFRNRITVEDFLIKDYSHKQNIIANEITGGPGTEIYIYANVQNTLLIANNINGTIDYPYTGTLPTSLYLNSVPDFFGTMSYPQIGPEVTFNTGTNPAREVVLNDEPRVSCLEFSTTDIPEIPLSDVSIMPNPCNDYFLLNIDRPSLYPSQITTVLADITGRLVNKQVIYPKEQTIKIETLSLPDGVYFFKILETGYSAKIIKLAP